jgi:hypothetical protein
MMRFAPSLQRTSLSLSPCGWSSTTPTRLFVACTGSRSMGLSGRQARLPGVVASLNGLADKQRERNPINDRLVSLRTSPPSPSLFFLFSPLLLSLFSSHFSLSLSLSSASLHLSLSSSVSLSPLSLSLARAISLPLSLSRGLAGWLLHVMVAFTDVRAGSCCCTCADDHVPCWQDRVACTEMKQACVLKHSLNTFP